MHEAATRKVRRGNEFSNSEHHPAPRCNSRPDGRIPAVNRRVAGSSPARGASPVRLNRITDLHGRDSAVSPKSLILSPLRAHGPDSTMFATESLQRLPLETSMIGDAIRFVAESNARFWRFGSQFIDRLWRITSESSH
jgi:hypothetical protein